MRRKILHDLPDAKFRLHVHVGSHEVPVFAADLRPVGEIYGCAFDSPEPEIWLNSTATKAQQARTLVHETLEVINNVYQLGLDETKIRILEQSLCQSFKMARKG
jgi:hypothetical protein